MTEYGRIVKKRLIEMDKSQVWLMEEIQKRRHGFMDSSYLSKILSGNRKAENIRCIINDILDIKED